MLAPIKPANEAVRIQALHGLNVLDSAPEERFDRLTRLAKRLFNVPIALVTLVDKDRQWFKSCVGLDVNETPRDVSFCGHAILQDELLLVPDAKQDNVRDDDLSILIPAFVASELTRAFEIGLLLYLPFLVIDLIVANILMTLGMIMVSPVLISIPLKLFLFVAIDGWSRLMHGLILSYS